MKEKLLNMKTGESIYVKKYVEVFKLYDQFAVFERPLHGGEPQFVDTYDVKNIDRMINHIKEVLI